MKVDALPDLSTANIQALERCISTFVGENVEITSLEKYAYPLPGESDHTFYAVIAYDGDDNRGHIGHIDFDARCRDSGNVEDFIVHNLTGSNFYYKGEKDWATFGSPKVDN